MGSKPKKKKATLQEKQLADIGKKKIALADANQGGRDYLNSMSEFDGAMRNRGRVNQAIASSMQVPLSPMQTRELDVAQPASAMYTSGKQSAVEQQLGVRNQLSKLAIGSQASSQSALTHLGKLNNEGQLLRDRLRRETLAKQWGEVGAVGTAAAFAAKDGVGIFGDNSLGTQAQTNAAQQTPTANGRSSRFGI